MTGSTWNSEHEPIKRWQKLMNKEKSFFLSMPSFQGSSEFVNDVIRLGGNVGYACQFLTAIPSIWEFPNAVEEKILWVAEKLGSDIPVVIAPYARDKASHCKPSDILIDDSDLNIQQWVDAGGLGILHVSFAKSINELTKLLDKSRV